jgi:isocitrate dehydrogenase kinase/phosphatase
VQFLRSLMPRKPRAELYNALGLAKQGKTLFYRDFLSTCATAPTSFRIAPGIKGMVMLVFDLPSFPFVFKVIKDFYPPQKDTTREQIKGKYLLVKQHDRVGRMADTLEFSARWLSRATASSPSWSPSFRNLRPASWKSPTVTATARPSSSSSTSTSSGA